MVKLNLKKFYNLIYITTSLVQNKLFFVNSENANEYAWSYAHEITLCRQHNNSEERLLK